MNAPSGVIKPVAIKLARPIPKRVTEEFYDEAYRQGIPSMAVNAALMETHDWHRKWVLQEEEGHTMPAAIPTPNFGGVTQAPPSYYAYVPGDLVDRDAGARNPSPELDHESPIPMFERKRSRMDLPEPVPSSPIAPQTSRSDIVPPMVQIVWDNLGSQVSALSSSTGSKQDYAERAPKRPVPVRVAPEVVPCDESPRDQLGEEHKGIHKPVPLRVTKPLPVRPHAARHVPDFIGSPHRMSVSPLTQAADSLGDQQIHQPQNGNYFQTVANIQDQPVHIVEDEVDEEEIASELDLRRDAFLQALIVADGDVDADKFKSRWADLEQHHAATKDRQSSSEQETGLQGTWLTLSKPTYFGNLGDNDAGDPMYTLGRMSFDMFSPSSLVCSLQGNFNTIEVVGDEQRDQLLKAGLVPKALREEVQNRDVVLRTYNIITAFTIEPHMAAFPDAPNKDVVRPIRGIMTTYGFTLPDPAVPNRHSIWITGGKVEPNDDPSDAEEWKRLFGLHPPKHSFGERAKLLAVKMLMGATIPDEVKEDGCMEYSFTKPLGGHGVAYVDVMYLDGSLRVVRGHRGTLFVFSKMQD